MPFIFTTRAIVKIECKVDKCLSRSWRFTNKSMDGLHRSLHDTTSAHSSSNNLHALARARSHILIFTRHTPDMPQKKKNKNTHTEHKRLRLFSISNWFHLAVPYSFCGAIVSRLDTRHHRCLGINTNGVSQQGRGGSGIVGWNMCLLFCWCVCGCEREAGNFGMAFERGRVCASHSVACNHISVAFDGGREECCDSMSLMCSHSRDTHRL